MEQNEQLTIADYQATAAEFREGTWNHDVSPNRNALVAAMSRNPGKILDLGCGPGRDLVAFKQQGHTVIGLDATPAFVDMAQRRRVVKSGSNRFSALTCRQKLLMGSLPMHR